MSTFSLYSILAAFLILNQAVGLSAGKGKGTFRDYALADRTLGLGFLTITLIATFVDGWLLDMVKYTWAQGIYSNLHIVGFFLTPIFFGQLIASQFVYYQDCITMGDMMKKFYGIQAQIITGLIGLFFSLIVIASQFYVLHSFYSHIFGSFSSTIVWVIGASIILYTLIGGLRSVAYTDAVQFGSIVVAFGIIIYSIIYKMGGIQHFIDLLHSEQGQMRVCPNGYSILRSSFSVFFWSIIPVYWITPPIIQRVLAVRSRFYIQKMFIGVAFFYFFLRVSVLFIGFSPLALNEFIVQQDLDYLLPDILKYTLGYNNEILFSVVVILLTMLMISTVDSFLHVIGVICVQDIGKPLLWIKEKKQFNLLFWARATTLVGGLVALTLGVGVNNIDWDQSAVRYIGRGLMLLTALVIPFLAGITGIKSKAREFTLSMIVYFVALALACFGRYYTLTYLPTPGIFYTEYSLPVLSFWAQFVFSLLYHVYQNRGVAMASHTADTTYHYTWRPSLKKFLVMLDPRGLVDGSAQEAWKLGMPTYKFAMFWCFSHMTPYVMMPDINGWSRLNELSLSIKIISVLLCVGLLMEDWWSEGMKRYFPLYWFFTLVFCLPFAGTLLFLANGRCSIRWGVTIAVILFTLSRLVTRRLFIILLGSGMISGYIVASMSYGFTHWVEQGDLHPISFTLGFIYLFTLTFLFARDGERSLSDRGWLHKKLKKSMIKADLIMGAMSTKPTSQMIGIILRDMMVRIKHEGEKGYFIPEAGYQALRHGTVDLLETGKQTEGAVDRLFSLMCTQVWDSVMTKNSAKKLIEDAYEGLLSEYRQQTALDTEDDFEIEVPHQYFNHLLYVIVQNSILHGQAEEVTVKLDATNRSLLIHDNGRGMSAEQLTHIFDLLYTKREEKHMGMGLVLAKRVVSALGGEISCESKQGNGSYTQFVIQFPPTKKKLEEV